jgi:5-deoxy-glucuronate isomerase
MAAPELRRRPRALGSAGGALVETTPADAGWEFLSFEARRLQAGGVWAGDTGTAEAALVVLGGRVTLETAAGRWELGERPHVFAGLPWSAYLPPGTHYHLTGREAAEIAWATAPATGRYPARLIPPSEVRVEERGAGTTARTVRHMLPPEFPAERLIVVEVITPEGHWSSYPPHKHDVENLPHENLLEETYYYHIDPPQGFALQRIYTRDDRWDVAVICEDGDLVLVPEGYHPVAAAAGYTCYYLNAQAGPSRAWLTQDDPRHTWVKTRP